MKKLAALILAGTMVFSLAACGNTAAESSSTATEEADTQETASEEGEAVAAEGETETTGSGEVYFEPGELTVANAEELPHYKIAFSYYSFADKLGLQFRESINYLCNAYNCEAVFFESGMGDEAVTNIESVLAAGDIDGVIYVGATPSVVAVAEKYEVPYVAVCGFASLDEEINTLGSYNYFLGCVMDDDVWAGEHAMQALYDAGCRSVCFSGATQGMLKSHDDRASAYLDYIASHDDMSSLTESYTMMETANDISTFAASFAGIMDGIFFTAGSDAIYLTMETEGIADGSVKIAAVDISSQTGTYFKNGTQVWTCGGQYGSAEMGFAVLYSYLADGTKIITDTKTPVIRQYLEITSYDDYEKYCQYVEGSTPVYTADELAAYIPFFTEGADLAAYEAEAVNYSIESLGSRR
ncbi:MAG: hypothetical protein NC416_01030 [Eubacterium sp.]|nr:hypothetical protein [Eubacterium sp.]